MPCDFPDAVIFDLDGVIIQSEEIWKDVRERFAREHDRRWTEEIQRAVMGMGPQEWPVHMRDELHLDMTAEQVRQEILSRVLEQYDAHLPVIAGAVEAVHRVAETWPVGLASSSDRILIDHVLNKLGLSGVFAATVSSEEVPHGKPSPDVYLAAVSELAVDASRAVAIEDSSNGIRAAHAAGLSVIAIPNPSFPPNPSALALASLELDTIDNVTAEVIRALPALQSAANNG